MDQKLNYFSPGGPNILDIGTIMSENTEKNHFLSKGGILGNVMNAREKNVKVPAFSRTFTT